MKSSVRLTTRGGALLLILLLALVLLVGVSLTYAGLAGSSITVGTTATAQVEASLTVQYGSEIQKVVETFENNWQSLEAHTNPVIQSELAAQPYLDYWGYARMGPKIFDEPFWLITTSATVTYLRVIEYESQRFRAVASIAKEINEASPTGEFVRALPKQESCNLYLFVQENETWKVADLFRMTKGSDNDRDWENLIAWERQFAGQHIMGDLPQETCPFLK